MTDPVDAVQSAEYRHLVRRIAGQLCTRVPAHVEMDALLHAGMVGLYEAACRYDERRGVPFGAYAARRIHGAMLDELRACDHLPRGARKRLNMVREAVRRLEHALGRAPRAREVADALGWTLAVLHAHMAQAGAGALRLDDRALEVSDDDAFDGTAGAGPHASIDDAGDPASALERRQRLEAVESACAHLSDREREVLRLVHGEQLTQRGAGTALGVTESRVCQLHASALAKLRRWLANC